MPKLIKNNQASVDEWQQVNMDQAATITGESLNSGFWLLPLETFVQLSDSIDLSLNNVGIWLASDTNLEALPTNINALPVIALNFDAFADGRSFSLARVLREQLDYSGEIRAVGAFIQDQLTYLKRCGFDAFSVADDANIDSLISSLDDFSESYQAAVDEPNPLFRRRA